MSRNWTPEEMLLVEKNGTPIIEFMKGLQLVINGEKRPMYTKEDIEICEQFTYLGKLYDRFARLYKEVCKYPKGKDILKELEAELKDYIEDGIEKEGSFVAPWFHGELDKGFYYNEENNRLFREEVMKKVRSMQKDDRMVKISAGMTQEFEVIQTNAPDEVILEQIRKNNQRSEEGVVIDEPYDVIEKRGYHVDVIGCQYDDELMEKIQIDAEFDAYAAKRCLTLEERIAQASEKIESQGSQEKDVTKTEKER